MIKIHSTSNIIMDSTPKQVYVKTITLFGVIPIFKRIMEQELEQADSNPESEVTSPKQIGFVTSSVHIEDEPYDNI